MISYTNHTNHTNHTNCINYIFVYCMKCIFGILKILYEGGISMKKPKGKYAWTVTVGEKGQIVIPKQARDVFGIKPGDTLVVLGDEDKGLAIPPKSMFAKFAAAVFETREEVAEDEMEEA